jgi:hypothetical protein
LPMLVNKTRKRERIVHRSDVYLSQIFFLAATLALEAVTSFLQACRFGRWSSVVVAVHTVLIWLLLYYLAALTD